VDSPFRWETHGGFLHRPIVHGSTWASASEDSAPAVPAAPDVLATPLGLVKRLGLGILLLPERTLHEHLSLFQFSGKLTGSELLGISGLVKFPLLVSKNWSALISPSECVSETTTPT